MVDPLDVWRTAKEMVRQHGDLAVIECSLKADEMLDRGDVDGRAVWMAVRVAAKSLLENGPPSDVSNG